MSFFPSLTHNAGVRHIPTSNTKVGRAVMAFPSAAFQNASPLVPAHKDLSAAFESGSKGNPGLFNTRGQALRKKGYEPLMAFLDAAAKNDLRA